MDKPANTATKSTAGKPSAKTRPGEPSLKVQGDKILGSGKPAAKKTTKGKGK